MMQSLWFKLAGIFALVILVSNGIVVLLANQATTDQFEFYVTQSGQQWAAQLSSALADYYARNGSWEGVESVLQNPWSYAMLSNSSMSGDGSGTMNGMMGGMGNSGMMREMDRWPGEQNIEMGMGMNLWAASGSRLLLAQEDGQIVADTAGQLVGNRLSDDDVGRGVSVTLQGQPIGTVLATLSETPTTPAGDFLGSVNRAVLWSSVVAGGIAIVLGSLLFLQVIRPLRSLSAAAQGIAAGDLSQRAREDGQDEVGQVARSFNQMAASLQSYENERRQTIAAIAHELRTPLSVIQGNLDAMLDGVLPTSEEELVLLHRESRLLNRLIDDLRTLSLADAGQLDLQMAPVDLENLITETVERLQLHAEANGIRLKAVTPGDLPQILADEARLSQVLTNLVDNAVRYTPEGTVVEVAARSVSGGVEVSVNDNGPGIPAEDIPRLFDRFWRGEKSRSRATGGSGLGLAVAKQLVQVHGGRIWVGSELNQGTRFTFHLPV
jgi:two-component system OmpR family sensor kinase/two-component system sensor histidine kinase BaeS